MAGHVPKPSQGRATSLRRWSASIDLLVGLVREVRFNLGGEFFVRWTTESTEPLAHGGLLAKP